MWRAWLSWWFEIGGIDLDKSGCLFKRTAEHLAESNMHFLNTGGDCRWYQHQWVCKVIQEPSIAAAECRSTDPEFARGFKAADDIAAAAGSTDANCEVAFATDCADLARE